VDGDGTIDYDGLDRITVSDTSYQEISNDWWKVTVSSVYNETNSATSITSSVSPCGQNIRPRCRMADEPMFTRAK